MAYIQHSQQHLVYKLKTLLILSFLRHLKKKIIICKPEWHLRKLYLGHLHVMKIITMKVITFFIHLSLKKSRKGWIHVVYIRKPPTFQ